MDFFFFNLFAIVKPTTLMKHDLFRRNICIYTKKRLCSPAAFETMQLHCKKTVTNILKKKQYSKMLSHEAMHSNCPKLDV